MLISVQVRISFSTFYRVLGFRREFKHYETVFYSIYLSLNASFLFIYSFK